MPAGLVEPHQGRRQIDKGDSLLTRHLERGQRAVGDRLLPAAGDVAAATDLRDGAATRFSPRREIEAHHLVIFRPRAVVRAVDHSRHSRRLAVGHIATPIDLLDQVSKGGLGGFRPEWLLAGGSATDR